MRSLGSDILIIGLSAIILPTFSFLLYRDFTYEKRTTKEKQIGKISFMQNIAKRKYSDQALWYNLGKESLLFNKDSIRTEEQSEAVVVLNDGTTLEISENSMILLDFSATGINIDFNYGSIQTKSSGNLNIKSKDKIISIKDGELKLSQKANQDLNLVVQKGKAKVKIGDKEKILKKDEQALLSKNDLKIKKIILIPVSPRHNKRFVSFSKKHNVTLTWRELPKDKNVFVEISRSLNFTKKTVNKTTKLNSFTASLSGGIYYWRLSKLKSKTRGKTKTLKRDYSDIRKFSILEERKLVLISPANKGKIDYYTTPPFVHFSWSESSFASSYSLEITRDKKFQNIVKSEKTRQASLSIDDLTGGKYFWRVKTRASIADIDSQTSDTYTFQIIKKKEIDPPKPVNPQNNRSISQFLFEKEGVVFNWLKRNELAKTELEISRDKEFKNKVLSAISEYNYITIKKKLPKGKYFWRLRGLTGKDGGTKFSRTWSFNAIDINKLTLLKPKDRAHFEYFSSRNKGISFIWKRPQTYGRFILEVSATRDFKDPAVKKTILSYSYNTADLKPGIYFWRVALTDNEGKRIIGSDTRRFSLARPLDDPMAVFPKTGQKIDMAKRNSLSIKWKAPKDSNQYVIEVFQDSSGWNKKKFSVKTKNSYITINNLSILDVGKFYWTVKAFKLGKNRKILRSSALIRTNFYIILSQDLKKPEIVSPKVQFLLD